jgi:hypothetical protein
MRIIILICIVGTFISCGTKQSNSFELEKFDGQLTQPKEAVILIENLCIDKFIGDKLVTLKRYFSGNHRWEVLQERGKVYAIRKERQDGKYLTTLNGFYSHFEDTSEIYQTRVIVSFGKYYGFGNNETGITFTDSKDKSLITTIESEHNGSPGNSSYLIIKGNNINIEIFEQARNLNRIFTHETIKELNAELNDVLKHEKEITDNGIMAATTYYPFKQDSTYFNIIDGIQPGIYIIQAGLKTDKEGFVYIRVFDSRTNKELSADRIMPRTTREIGWSTKGRTVFQYESELTVYEGDWEHQYEARFEIWFKSNNQQEKKLAEKSRIINGWER